MAESDQLDDQEYDSFFDAYERQSVLSAPNSGNASSVPSRLGYQYDENSPDFLDEVLSDFQTESKAKLTVVTKDAGLRSPTRMDTTTDESPFAQSPTRSTKRTSGDYSEYSTKSPVSQTVKKFKLPDSPPPYRPEKKKIFGEKGKLKINVNTNLQAQNVRSPLSRSATSWTSPKKSPVQSPLKALSPRQNPLRSPSPKDGQSPKERKVRPIESIDFREGDSPSPNDTQSPKERRVRQVGSIEFKERHSSLPKSSSPERKRNTLIPAPINPFIVTATENPAPISPEIISELLPPEISFAIPTPRSQYQEIIERKRKEQLEAQRIFKGLAPAELMPATPLITANVHSVNSTTSITPIVSDFGSMNVSSRLSSKSSKGAMRSATDPIPVEEARKERLQSLGIFDLQPQVKRAATVKPTPLTSFQTPNHRKADKVEYISEITGPQLVSSSSTVRTIPIAQILADLKATGRLVDDEPEPPKPKSKFFK